MGQLRTIRKELGWTAGIVGGAIVALGLIALLAPAALTAGITGLIAADDLQRGAREQELASALDAVNGIDVIGIERRPADLGTENLFATVVSQDGEADATLLGDLSAIVDGLGLVGVQLIADDRTIGISPSASETSERLELADELLALDGARQATVLWRLTGDDVVQPGGQQGVRAVVQTDGGSADLLALAVAAGEVLRAITDRGSVEAIAPPASPLVDLHDREQPSVQDGLRRITIDIALEQAAWDSADPGEVGAYLGEGTLAITDRLRTEPGVHGYDWRIAAGASTSLLPGRIAAVDDATAEALCDAFPESCSVIEFADSLARWTPSSPSSSPPAPPTS